jgi:hypothetical protein
MKRIFIASVLLFLFPAAHGQQDFINRLVEIKYTTEMYLGNAIKKSDAMHNNESRDSAMAIYNTLRYKIDGLVYGLSADMIAANSPRRLRLLNEWCLNEPSIFIKEKTSTNIIKQYTKQLFEIDALYQSQIVASIKNDKTINLTTNVFYLLKDSYTIIKGLTDMKTQKTMALVELLDHMRLLSPGEVGKIGK